MFFQLPGCRKLTYFLAGAFGTVVLGAALTGCQSGPEVITHEENNLAAAGFVVRPANTPARQAMLQRLPANKFVTRTHHDVVHYVYADPVVCDCLYVGTQEAYGKYRLAQQQQHLADEQRETAQSYSDASWNWDAWGPGAYRGFWYGSGYGW